MAEHKKSGLGEALMQAMKNPGKPVVVANKEPDEDLAEAPEEETSAVDDTAQDLWSAFQDKDYESFRNGLRALVDIIASK